MTASDVLRQAAALIAAGWCPYDHASDALGSTVPLFGGSAGDTARAGINPDAVHFSLYGAVVKALHMTSGVDPRPIWIKLNELVQATGYTTGGTNHLHPVIGYNNAEGRTAAEVQAILLLAAEELETGPVTVVVQDLPATLLAVAVDPARPGPDQTVTFTQPLRSEIAPEKPPADLRSALDRVGPNPFGGKE